MSLSIDEVVGRVLAEIVAKEMGDVIDAGDGNAPMIRTLGFERSEILVAAADLGQRRAGALKAVTIKIGSREIQSGLDSGWFLQGDETCASLRNDCGDGLILFDLEHQPDEQSLRNMHVLSDATILEPGVEGARKTRLEIVLAESWKSVGPGVSENVPEVLRSATESLFDILQDMRGRVSLRLWVKFVLECCEKIKEAGDVVSRDLAWNVVAQSLPALDLFVDPRLYEAAEGKSVAVWARQRLKKNIAWAESAQDDEDLEKRIEAAQFVDEDGELLSLVDQEALRDSCRRIVNPSGPIAWDTVTFDQWARLFENESKRRGLGERAREHLALKHSERLEEYEILDVSAGLDGGDRECAEKLLKEEPPDAETPALADVLTKTLRRQVERVARPSSPTVEKPLLRILKVAYDSLAADSESPRPGFVRLALDSTHSGQEEPLCLLSLPLFRFLYAGALGEVVESSETGNDVRFEVDARLLTGPCDFVAEWGRVFPESGGANYEEDESGPTEEELEKAWQPLRLILETGDEDDGGTSLLDRFTWSPSSDVGRAAFARIIIEGEENVFFDETSGTLEAWCSKCLDPRQSIGGYSENVNEDGPLGDWIEDRRERFGEWRANGLSSVGLSEYHAVWQDSMRRARVEYVPQGSENQSLSKFLDVDMLSVGNVRVMLASHPLRLRWLGHYLAEMASHIGLALAGRLHLNEELDSLFFDKKSEMSPHRQPPLVSTGYGEAALATREFGWHEEFSPIVTRDGASRDWVSAIDDSSIDELAHVVHLYLESYPHKVDGLSLLFMSRDGDSGHVERLVRKILQGAPKDIAMTVHVVAPVLAHEAMARALENLDTTEPDGRLLMPRLRTIVHPETLIDNPEKADLADVVDLALVPNVFGTRTDLQVHTIGLAREGQFKVLLEPTSHDRNPGGQQSENISRALLPEFGDDLLEGWSTLTVWRKNESPVGQAEDGAVDYSALRVRFSESLELFTRLHSWAHWVVTLDPFVGREQIEAMPSRNRPDVITVKPHVGKNGNYTIVVSSDSGKKFVVSRLLTRLERDLGVASGQGAEDLARELYEAGRGFAAGVILRALGLGRTAHEILGLLVARWVIAERFPRPEAFRFEAWINLDENTRWFGGAHRHRADFLRLIALRDDDGVLHLRFRAVEAKYRSVEDSGNGDRQLSRTLEILEPAFRPAANAASPARSIQFGQRPGSAAAIRSPKLRAPRRSPVRTSTR